MMPAVSLFSASLRRTLVLLCFNKQVKMASRFPLAKLINVLNLSENLKLVHFHSFTNVFVLLTVSIGRTELSITSRWASRNGGNDNFSPKVS